MGNFEKYKIATCSTVHVGVTNINFNLLTFVVAKLWG